MPRWIWIGLAIVVVIVALVVTFIVRVLRKQKWIADMGKTGEAAFWVAVVYAIFPLDILPDPVYIDDIGVAAAAALVIIRQVTKNRKKRKTGALPPVPTKRK